MKVLSTLFGIMLLFAVAGAHAQETKLQSATTMVDGVYTVFIMARGERVLLAVSEKGLTIASGLQSMILSAEAANHKEGVLGQFMIAGGSNWLLREGKEGQVTGIFSANPGEGLATDLEIDFGKSGARIRQGDLDIMIGEKGVMATDGKTSVEEKGVNFRSPDPSYSNLEIMTVAQCLTEISKRTGISMPTLQRYMSSADKKTTAQLTSLDFPTLSILRGDLDLALVKSVMGKITIGSGDVALRELKGKITIGEGDESLRNMVLRVVASDVEALEIGEEAVVKMLMNDSFIGFDDAIGK